MIRGVALLLLVGACASVEVERVLDNFHDAAAQADEERYFAHFANNAVFLGTDARERWTVREFRAYAHPRFAKGEGWTYRPRDRHVEVVHNIAWFDELLEHDRYGELRGSGILRKIDGSWKIVQYNLAFTVPNEAARDVVERIRSGPP